MNFIGKYILVAQTKDGSVAMDLRPHNTIKACIEEFDSIYDRKGFKIMVLRNDCAAQNLNQEASGIKPARIIKSTYR